MGHIDGGGADGGDLSMSEDVWRKGKTMIDDIGSELAVVLEEYLDDEGYKTTIRIVLKGVALIEDGVRIILETSIYYPSVDVSSE